MGKWGRDGARMTRTWCMYSPIAGEHRPTSSWAGGQSPLTHNPIDRPSARRRRGGGRRAAAAGRRAATTATEAGNGGGGLSTARHGAVVVAAGSGLGGGDGRRGVGGWRYRMIPSGGRSRKAYGGVRHGWQTRPQPAESRLPAGLGRGGHRAAPAAPRASCSVMRGEGGRAHSRPPPPSALSALYPLPFPPLPSCATDSRGRC